MASTLESVLADLAQTLEQEGCRLIGHIKALAHSHPQGHLYASLVSLEQGVSLRGELPSTWQEVRLTLNLIVYGLEQERLPALLDRCVERGFPGAVRTSG